MASATTSWAAASSSVSHDRAARGTNPSTKPLTRSDSPAARERGGTISASKDHDPDGYSIPAQREACLRKAAQIEAQVVDEYLDRGESAKSADRPALKAMLRRIESDHDVDLVIVHKIDRLARSRYDDATINLAIRQAGAELVSVSESIDDTPPGQLLHAIMAANAEFYSRNLARCALRRSQGPYRGAARYACATSPAGKARRANLGCWYVLPHE